jgi:D-aminopeptidase
MSQETGSGKTQNDQLTFQNIHLRNASRSVCLFQEDSTRMASEQNQAPTTEARQRARQLGIKVGILPTGQLNTITDVNGVLVGHTTLIRGENIRTGVTAILPHGGNLSSRRVPGTVFVGNAFGKLAGSAQVNELGEIETPILLTSTLSVPRVADAVLDYMLALPGNEKSHVGESSCRGNE